MYKKLSFIASLFFIAILHFFSTSSVQAATCSSSNIRFASSSNTIYVTGPVDCTLSNIKSIRPTVPLTLVNADSKVWLLKANLKLEQGARLDLHGDSIGGDVNELRLISNNSSLANSTIWIRAHWGTIDISNTKITSWNEAASGPDTEYASFKRSYIHARSFLDGSTPRESRMDIKNSDIGYLGYNAAESYGLAWKVLGPSPGVFETVNIYGDVVNSHIHHNYFGIYTYGAYGMNIINNDVHDNVKYGLDPHDDSDFLIIEGNSVYNNGNHGIICSKRCDHIAIKNNTVSGSIGNGIFLHNNITDSVVENNTLQNNSDSGIALFDSHRNIVKNNKSLSNKHGMRLSVGSSENTIENNEFALNSDYGLYFYKGSDTPISGDGHPKQNIVRSNSMHDNGSYVIKIQEADNNTFENNTFLANAKEMYLYNSKDNRFVSNSFSGANNFYNANASSTATIQNTDSVRAKIGSSAGGVITLINTENFIIKNDKNLVTLAEEAQTKVTFPYPGSNAIVTFNRINFQLVPSDATITAKLTTWNTSGDYYKKWTETASVSTISTNHTIGDLAPNTPYDVFVNGILFNAYTVSDTGVISFLYNGGYDTPKVFEVIEGSLAAIEATPTEGASNSGELEGI